MEANPYTRINCLMQGQLRNPASQRVSQSFTDRVNALLAGERRARRSRFVLVCKLHLKLKRIVFHSVLHLQVKSAALRLLAKTPRSHLTSMQIEVSQ